MATPWVLSICSNFGKFITLCPLVHLYEIFILSNRILDRIIITIYGKFITVNKLLKLFHLISISLINIYY